MEDGNTAIVAVVAKAMAEGGGVVEEIAATVVTECSDCHPTLSVTITAPAKAGAMPARTMTAGGGGCGGGGGGKKNCHTPFFSRRRTAILPDCTDSHGGVLDVVHCRRIGVGGGGGSGGGVVGGGGIGGVSGSGAHPSDIGRTTMRAAEGEVPTTTAATATMRLGTAAAT